MANIYKAGNVMWLANASAPNPRFFLNQAGFAGSTAYLELTEFTDLLGQHAIASFTLAEDGITLFVVDDQGNLYR
jgi:hypothetical protein